jgi:hypothetical protein
MRTSFIIRYLGWQLRNGFLAAFVRVAGYTDKRIEVSIVFRHTIPSSGNRLRSESRILSGSGGVEAQTLSGQRRAALCRTNVTASGNGVGASPLNQAGATPRSAGPHQAQRPHSIS